ncbi:alpha/beta hydrolase [Flavitalea sp.]
MKFLIIPGLHGSGADHWQQNGKSLIHRRLPVLNKTVGNHQTNKPGQIRFKQAIKKQNNKYRKTIFRDGFFCVP